MAVPYYAFRAAGYDVTLASLAGGAIPVDAAGTGEREQAAHPELARFFADGAHRAPCATLPLSHSPTHASMARKRKRRGVAEADLRRQKQIDWKAELRAGRIRARVIYSEPNRRRAEQVEAALQQWDLTENQPAGELLRFSLHQRWMENFAAKPCAGHVLLVEVTKEFFDEHRNAVFVLRQRGIVHVGKGGEGRN